MEPLAHTLTGACLAEAGLKRATPLGVATLVIAATVADVDGACYLHSADLAFGIRRGITHGVLGWIVLPVLVTAAILTFDRHVRLRRNPGAAPAKQAPVFWLSLVGVLSHPILDWFNSYGVRLLSPFSDTWFYGDTLFIVDPWLWVILGTAVVLGWTVRRRGMVLWSGIGAVATFIIMSNGAVPAWGKVLWLIALTAMIGMRLSVPESARPRAALAALALAAGYVTMMYTGSRMAERQARQFAAARGWDVGRVAAMTVPVDWLRRVVIVETPTRYYLVPDNWLNGPDQQPSIVELELGPSLHPAVAAVLGLPQFQGTRRWLRFPSYQVDTLPGGGYRVIIRDARFTVGTPRGFGWVINVTLDRNLQPTTSS